MRESSQRKAAFQGRQTATGPIALGDLGFAREDDDFWPLVVVDSQDNKTGVVDLDTGEPKYFGSGFVSRLRGLPVKRANVQEK